MLCCAAVGVIAYGDALAADVRPDIPAFPDGIYIENASGFLTHYFASVDAGLAVCAE